MTKNVAYQQQDSAGTHTSPSAANDTESDNIKLLDQMTHHSGDERADLLTFFGFAPLRKRLSGHALDFLLNHLRWAKPEDPPEVVGKKNVIIMFTIHAEVEDCLVQIPIAEKPDKFKSLGLLQQLLGISYMKGPRAYTFARAILKAYTNSRYEQIIHHLQRGQWPPEPEMPIDKVLLSVVDRRLVFMFTHQPLHTTLVHTPHSRLQHHRVKLERLLSNNTEVEKAFTAFKPMVPEANQKASPKPWHIKLWLQEQERLSRKAFNLPQTVHASKVSGSREEADTTMVDIDGRLSHICTSYIPVMEPNSSKISCGMSIYTLGIRLACNHISTHTSAHVTPEIDLNFSDMTCGIIEGFAEYLERHLASHPPDSVGQYRAADQSNIAINTSMNLPEQVHKILKTGIQMVLVGLESEDLSLVGWSCVAAEVQRGKAAVQNTRVTSLTRGLTGAYRRGY